MNKFIAHFALIILEFSFNYLHKRFDIYYDIEDECYAIEERTNDHAAS